MDMLNTRDRKLWEKITTDPSHALSALLPSKCRLELRNWGHDYEVLIVHTERFERVFLNICLLMMF
jgi:hypothetical protein